MIEPNVTYIKEVMESWIGKDCEVSYFYTPQGYMEVKFSCNGDDLWFNHYWKDVQLLTRHELTELFIADIQDYLAKRKY